MGFWESGSFEEFKVEVIKAVEEKASSILKNAEKKAGEIERSAKREAERLKRDKLSAALKQLEEEFAVKKKELEKNFNERLNELIADFRNELFLRLLTSLDYRELFDCFKRQVQEKHGSGKFLVGCRLRGDFPELECTDEEGVLFKFEGKNVAVVFDESELKEAVEEEIQRLLREV